MNRLLNSCVPAVHFRSPFERGDDGKLRAQPPLVVGPASRGNRPRTASLPLNSESEPLLSPDESRAASAALHPAQGERNAESKRSERARCKRRISDICTDRSKSSRQVMLEITEELAPTRDVAIDLAGWGATSRFLGRKTPEYKNSRTVLDALARKQDLESLELYLPAGGGGAPEFELRHDCWSLFSKIEDIVKSNPQLTDLQLHAPALFSYGIATLARMNLPANTLLDLSGNVLQDSRELRALLNHKSITSIVLRPSARESGAANEHIVCRLARGPAITSLDLRGTNILDVAARVLAENAGRLASLDVRECLMSDDAQATLEAARARFRSLQISPVPKDRFDAGEP